MGAGELSVERSVCANQRQPSRVGGSTRGFATCPNLGHVRPESRAALASSCLLFVAAAARCEMHNRMTHKQLRRPPHFGCVRRSVLWHAACKEQRHPPLGRGLQNTNPRFANHSHRFVILPSVAHALVGAVACRLKANGPSLLRLTNRADEYARCCPAARIREGRGP
jgi:hypothetical protein